jgi:hypothetical protein
MFGERTREKEANLNGLFIYIGMGAACWIGSDRTCAGRP